MSSSPIKIDKDNNVDISNNSGTITDNAVTMAGELGLWGLGKKIISKVFEGIIKSSGKADQWQTDYGGKIWPLSLNRFIKERLYELKNNPVQRYDAFVQLRENDPYRLADNKSLKNYLAKIAKWFTIDPFIQAELEENLVRKWDIRQNSESLVNEAVTYPNTTVYFSRVLESEINWSFRYLANLGKSRTKFCYVLEHPSYLENLAFGESQNLVKLSEMRGKNVSVSDFSRSPELTLLRHLRLQAGTWTALYFLCKIYDNFEAGYYDGPLTIRGTISKQGKNVTDAIYVRMPEYTVGLVNDGYKAINQKLRNDLLNELNSLRKPLKTDEIKSMLDEIKKIEKVTLRSFQGIKNFEGIKKSPIQQFESLLKKKPEGADLTYWYKKEILEIIQMRQKTMRAELSTIIPHIEKELKLSH